MSELTEWVRDLGLDDLRCLVALGEPEAERRTSLPDGMALDEARSRARALLENAPSSVRLAFAEESE